MITLHTDAGQWLRHMLVVLIMLGMLLPKAAPAAAQSFAGGPADPAEVAAFFDEFLATAMQEHAIPGAVVVLVKDGQLFFSRGYGYADLEARVPVDPAQTVFRIASVSKLFTWTAVMQLVEQGRLKLDEDVNSYLDFRIPATYPEPITLNHLMNHTAGFEERAGGLFKLDPAQVLPLDAYLKATLPERVFVPGSTGAYSNYGAALAGYIVERVSGQPFAEYIEGQILAPLEMQHSSFRQPLPAALAANLAGGYNYVEDRYLRGEFEYVVASPGGAMSASGLDMANFMLAHLQEGQYKDARILQPETARQMHSRSFQHDPRLTGMAHGFDDGLVSGQRVLSHTGDTVLFHSGLYLLPEQELGLFIASNSTGGEPLAEDLSRAFLERYYPTEPAPPPTPTADFASRAAQYVGSYYLSRSNFSTYEKFNDVTFPISVEIDQQNHVLLTIGGQTSAFVEVEPGLIQNLEHPERKMVMLEADGQVRLYSSGPFVFFKKPWYGMTRLHLLIIAGGAALFLLALLVWGWQLLRNRGKQATQPLPARLARLNAAIFGLTFLVFLLLLGSIFGNVNPVYGVPAIFFETPPWLGAMLGLGNLLGLLGVAMLPFSVLAWWRGYWSTGERVFYSLLTLVAAVILWALNYWNVLL